MFDSFSELSGKLAAAGYFIDPVMTKVVFLAAKLRKPLILEGLAGSGKTQLALSVAQAAETHIERLQCYDGITSRRAIGEFDESLQRLFMELISEGAGSSIQPVDFLIEYRVARGFMIPPDGAVVPASPLVKPDPISLPVPTDGHLDVNRDLEWPSMAAIDAEYELQMQINAPDWTKWPGQQIETSIGDIRGWNNETMLSYSIFNNSDKPIEIVPTQIQLTERARKKKKKAGGGVIADQLEIRDYRLSATRIEPGKRADGAIVFDRPNFKQSAEKLFLQIAEADQVDHPILISLPFTPPIAGRKDLSNYEPQ